MSIPDWYDRGPTCCAYFQPTDPQAIPVEKKVEFGTSQGVVVCIHLLAWSFDINRRDRVSSSEIRLLDALFCLLFYYARKWSQLNKGCRSRDTPQWWRYSNPRLLLPHSTTLSILISIKRLFDLRLVVYSNRYCFPHLLFVLWRKIPWISGFVIYGLPESFYHQ